MSDSEREEVAAKITERILVAVQMAERLKGVEMRAERVAEEMQHIDARLVSVEKSSWKAAGAIAALLFVIEFARHFKVF